MNRTIIHPPDAQIRGDGAMAGGWWHDAEDGRIVCDLCPRACSMKPGDRGFCFVRQNVDGEMVLTTFGRSTGFCIDPIEKKPLNHFYPGTPVLSFGTAGCNLGCKFCQNWDISKSREVTRLSELAMPEMIAAAAQEYGCKSVAYTYNDPIIWAEYAIETAKACKAIGLESVAVTAGYIQPAARETFFHAMDAANVDLKSFSEEFYHKITYSHLQPVLDTLRWLKHESDVWFEITNLVIPDANDSDDELKQMCEWVLESVGDDVPIHFSAFHPDYRMQDRPRTPHETLLRARQIALQSGLRYAYVGNVNDVANQSTYCHACGALLIERNWYELGAYHLNENRCAHCNEKIPGRFATKPGDWGRRRQPVRIANYVDTHAPDRTNQSSTQVVSISTAPKQEPSMNAPATVGKVTLTKDQQRSIHLSVCEFVNDVVHGRDPQMSDPSMAGSSEETVMGAFVTLKRAGHLRACCGSLGKPMRLIEAIYSSAFRTAKEDTRLPPISPTELRYLTLDVTLLSNFQPVAQTGEDRVDAVKIGTHGLRIARGNQAGLLLPSVATERGWDSRTFLQQVCRKAQLPITAWQDPATQLMTFDGDMIDGDFETSVFRESDERPPTILSHDSLVILHQHAHNNIVALATGAASLPYAAGCDDSTVNGVTIRLNFNGDESGVSFANISMRPGFPLQSTLYTSCQAAAKWIVQYAPHALQTLNIDLVVHTDPALHGTVGDHDIRGVDTTKRTILVAQPPHSAWVFDQTSNETTVMSSAVEYLKSNTAKSAAAYTLETVSTTNEFAYANVPVAQMGNSVRLPSVAGRFYPADPSEVASQVKDLLGQPPAQRRSCHALMVPHAGWRFSGRLAAEAFQQVEIPDTVIIIGPKHTRNGVRWAVAPHETWQLPGGSVSSDVALAKRLSDSIDGLQLDAAAHQSEHGIEVELPFIRSVNPDTKVVGITMGGGDWESCQAFADGLVQVIGEMKTPPLLVVSSDMNHYATDEENRRLDEIALSALDKSDPKLLLETVTNNAISMCGVLPCVTIMEALRRMNRLKKAQRLGYATSAESSGDTSRVVGYASVIWS